jgi:hypothetical protein
MSNSRWWYGITVFPATLLTALLSRFGTRAFLTASASSGNPDVGVAVASFLLSVLSFWLGLFVGLLASVCLLLDVRSLRSGDHWSPSRLWGLVGVIHLAAAVYSPLLLVSFPALSAYLYRRHVIVGRP